MRPTFVNEQHAKFRERRRKNKTKNLRLYGETCACTCASYRNKFDITRWEIDILIFGVFGRARKTVVISPRAPRKSVHIIIITTRNSARGKGAEMINEATTKGEPIAARGATDMRKIRLPYIYIYIYMCKKPFYFSLFLFNIILRYKCRRTYRTVENPRFCDRISIRRFGGESFAFSLTDRTSTDAFWPYYYFCCYYCGSVDNALPGYAWSRMDSVRCHILFWSTFSEFRCASFTLKKKKCSHRVSC